MVENKKNSAPTRANAVSVAEMVSVKELLPWVKNPRKNDHAVKKIAESIRRFGFASPIIARRENGEVIAGHTRLKAAKQLGLQEVPVRYLDISEREAHLLALADNKLGEVSEWDEQELSKMLSEFSLSEADAAGWGLKELGEMAQELDAQEASSRQKLGAGLKYSVIIECADEDEQTEMLERFEIEGLKCKPLIT